jgi:hypothetical protein
MSKPIPEENVGLWFTTFGTLINGGCPEDQAKTAADIVATDDYSINMQGGRSESDQALIKQTLKYLQGDSDD